MWGLFSRSWKAISTLPKASWSAIRSAWRPEGQWSRTFFWYLFWIEALALTIVIAVGFDPDKKWLRLDFWQDDSGAPSRSEVVRNIGLLAIAVAAALFAAWRNGIAASQARNEKQGQITDRFAKAVELLGSDNPTVRIGAIYALGRIAQDSMLRDHIPVMQVLSNFIRHSPYAEEQEDSAADYAKQFRTSDESKDTDKAKPKKPPTREAPDLLAAMQVIAERTWRQKQWEEDQSFSPTFTGARLLFLNLNGANLEHANLERANFEGANLERANLRSAKLEGTDLRNAKLKGAGLTGANLQSANLQSAKLESANLTGANLHSAKLEGAILHFAELKTANFYRANLHRTYLQHSNLEGANLQHSNLEGANLDRAKLVSADLLNANLRDAYLHGVSLLDARLSLANLNGAFLEEANLTKAGLTNANLANANLKRAGCVSAKLLGADLEGADLEGADLEGADLEGANLTRANLTDVKGLTPAQIANCYVNAPDDQPTLPTGLAFDGVKLDVR